MPDNHIDRHRNMIMKLLRHEYGLKAELVPLGGVNENYQVHAADGRKYVLKMAKENDDRSIVDLEIAAAERVHGSECGFRVPHLVRTLGGNSEGQLDEGRLRGRLFEYVEGKAWNQTTPARDAQLEDLGVKIARMDVALAGLQHAAGRRSHAWDLAKADQHRADIAVVPDAQRRQILEDVFRQYAAVVKPRLTLLDRALIHGDVNDDNVLVHGGRVAGILDFGDCLENPVVCELAIALAYLTLDEADRLRAGSIIIRGYQQVRPLSDDEKVVLFPMMLARLGTSVIISAKARKIDPARESWYVSEARAWESLQALSALSPLECTEQLFDNAVDATAKRSATSLNDAVHRRKKIIGPSLSLTYRQPLQIVRGRAQYLYDDAGKAHLDLYNNVCHVGHCHPRVVEAGQKQMAILNTNTRYLYPLLAEYAETLCATLPDELDTCYFVNSGTEANELALRLARAHTGQKDILVVAGAYHGHTNTLIDISPYKFLGKGGKGKAEDWVHIVPVADGYRGPYKGQGADAGHAYAEEVRTIIRDIGRPIAGFITESLLSCGGQVIPPEGYMKRAFEHVRKAGGICIADEVQVGFGRVGSHFWAFEMLDVVPDIVVLGKPIGNGHPMGAVITKRKIAESFANGMEFFSTFGGNPVSCAIGISVMDVIREEGLQENAMIMGKRMMEGLRVLQDRHELMGDVRGAGLFIGIELVRDRTTLDPATEEAATLVERLKDRGILLGTDGPFDNVIKIKPPMVVNRDDVDMFMRVLDDELAGMMT